MPPEASHQQLLAGAVKTSPFTCPLASQLPTALRKSSASIFPSNSFVSTVAVPTSQPMLRSTAVHYHTPGAPAVAHSGRK